MNPSLDRAQLVDVRGRAISQGRAARFTDGSFTFYPQDLALSEAIVTAKCLIFPDQKESFSIARIERCQAETSQELHFHVRITDLSRKA